GMFDEDKQFCAINYEDGFQNMILAVDTSEKLRGEKAVWIFPVPAEPEKATINLLKGFPRLYGYDVEEEAKESISGTFMAMRCTQVYTFPLVILQFSLSKMSAGAFGGDISGITVHQRVEKMGLTTELISAVDTQSFSDYLTRKDLELPDDFKSILDEYIGQEYSFVITWISDFEYFRQQNPISYISDLVEEGKISEAKSFLKSLSFDNYSEEKYIYELIEETLDDNSLETFDSEAREEFVSDRLRIFERHLGFGKGNTIGVFIGFPTEKIYYPLKPTSVYGDTKIPMVIYVMGHVTPELYPEIKTMGLSLSSETKDKQVNYFVERHYDVPDELSPFFNGKTEIENLKYTKIKIDTPSKYLTRDLWIKDNAPLKLKIADFVVRYPFWYGLFFFIVCSCLASLFAGTVLFKDTNISKRNFALLGLFNFLTLIGFGIASYLLRTKEISNDVKDYLSKNGLEAFENPRKKYYIALSVFACLSILLFILRGFELDQLITEILIIVLFVPITVLAILILSFKLSRENLKEEHKSNFGIDKASYKIVDIKKLVYLTVFNFGVFLGTLFLIISDYDRVEGLAELFGFTLQIHSWLTVANLPMFMSFIISSELAISVLLLIFLDKLFKNKFGTKGFYILQKDSRKVWFVLLFTILFLILTVIFELLLKTLV
ncbi:MAG: hypothetical protein U9Q92_04660, partial [archaeon]|nr:hypothetical protein [archaeon]